MNKIYLDNAATTAMDEEVIEVMAQSMLGIYGNPSSVHQFGRSAKSEVEKARKNIAKLLNVTASEIVFTAGGSEADNMILRNAVSHLQVKRIITSRIEHHAVLHTVEILKEDAGVEIVYVDINEDGSINMEHFETLLKSSTHKTLVSLMYVNNEIGSILDVDSVSKLCIEYNALFHSDAVQAIGHYKVDLQKTPIDFVVASAHKFHGPKGVGLAYFKKGFGIKPILTGGSQERGARAGTENVHGILGMEKALEIGCENLDEDTEYIGGLKVYFIAQLELHLPAVKINGAPMDKISTNYSILNVRLPVDSQMLLFTLDLKGIAVSGGSACQSGSLGSSHVLNEILSAKDSLKTSIRFSFSKFNTYEEIDFVIHVLKEILNK
jgi:cysteine desulfurase